MAHRVKQAVIQRAADSGVDLGGLGSERSAKRKLPKPCELLTKEAISQLVGEPIERVEQREARYLYSGPAGLSKKLALAHASDAFKRAQSSASQADGMEVASSVDQLINSAGLAMGHLGWSAASSSSQYHQSYVLQRPWP